MNQSDQFKKPLADTDQRYFDCDAQLPDGHDHEEHGCLLKQRAIIFRQLFRQEVENMLSKEERSRDPRWSIIDIDPNSW